MAECERIIHVLHSMNCGGAENLLMNIYRNIDREKVQFDFLVNVFSEMYFQKEIGQFGGRIYRMKTLLNLTPLLYKLQLTEFFENHKEYKIVHSHLETTTGIILSCARKAGVPVRIAHAHNSRYTRTGGVFELENAYKSFCRQKILPNATGFFACSVPASEWLFKSDSKDAVIIKNGIDTERFRFSKTVRAQIAKELGISDKTTVLAHTGRFYDQKNHMFLIDVFEAYRRINPCSLLLLAGEGPLQKQIMDKAASKGLAESVRFLGIRDDINRILQRADAFLFPSKFEGLPLALVEAQCAGLKCYVSDCVPFESDLDCGLVTFLPLKSAKIWAETIQPADSNRVYASAAVAAAGYDIKETARRLEVMYLEMLHQT
jgi:glycosyltransferase involved in cell wall biosynthesis